MTGIGLTALAGIGSWTLVEYVLHRFFGHDRRTWPNAFAAEHTRHHSEGDYFAPTWKKAIVTVVAAPVVTAVAALGLGLQLGAIYGVSFVGMYVTYELIHRRAHTHRGRGPYGRYLRRHHFSHHFANPRANHGVTSPIWDLIFGTWQAPGRIRVPAKLQMCWLVDPRTGDVYEDLAADYEIVRRAA
jgi:sterol desaturase/sphingolipid hydroxylase (fatty acid hydroxylase superfamily)